uniref:Uncharacterized protein n=1 Tax=Setaria italica TaxID=4555 RepID=K3XUG8_SETIT
MNITFSSNSSNKTLKSEGRRFSTLKQYKNALSDHISTLQKRQRRRH